MRVLNAGGDLERHRALRDAYPPPRWPSVGPGLGARVLADARCALNARVLLERLALRSMCRAVGGMLQGRLGELVRGGEAVPDLLPVSPLTGKQHGRSQRLVVAWKPVSPAMAAGLTDHIWTMDELLSFRVPPEYL